MPFDLENLNPACRFFWEDEDNEDDKKGDEEWVDLRLCSDDDVERFQKEAEIKQKVEYRRDRGRLHRVEFVDSDKKKMNKLSDLVNDFVVVNWRLLSKKREEIPCNLENKKIMFGKSPQFSEWIASCLEKMRQDIKMTEDRETKNSETT